MPNWCATNYILRGERADLERLARTLNTMPNLKNGFGRYWEGNLVGVLLGKTRDEIVNNHYDCRGTFDPNPEACACFFGPNPDEAEEFSLCEDGTLRYTMVNANYRSVWMQDLIKEHFPSVEFSFRSTDEFGNFHVKSDPLNEFPKYKVDDFEHEREEYDDIEKFASRMRELYPEVDIPDNADEKYFLDQFWKDGNKVYDDDNDSDNRWPEVEVIIWEEV